MGSRNLEDAWRQAMARRSKTKTKTAMATACLPYLVDSSFRARPAPATAAVQPDADQQGDDR